MLDPVSAAIIAGGTIGAASLSGGGGGDVSQVSTLTPGQYNLLEKLTKTLLPQINQGITPYSGQRVPGVSGLQQQGFDIFRGYMPLAGEGQTALSEAFSRYNPDAAGQFQQMGADALARVTKDFDPENITNALEPARQLGLQSFREDIVPYLTEHYAAGGDIKSSGAMNRALANAAKDFSLGFSANAAPYYIQGYENNLNRNLSAVPEAYRMGMMPTDVLNQVISGPGSYGTNLATMGIGAGGIERGIEGEQLGARQQYWTEAQPWMNPYLQQYLPAALGTQATENIYEQNGPNAASMMMPAFGSMLGMYAGNKLFPAGAGVNQGVNMASTYPYGTSFGGTAPWMMP